MIYQRGNNVLIKEVKRSFMVHALFMNHE